MVSAMRLATLGVSSMKQALGLFRDVMELKVESEGPVPQSLLDAWHVPAGTKAIQAILSCKGYPIGRLRLVQYTPTPAQKVRIDHSAHHTEADTGTDVGIKAIDFYVRDPILDAVGKIEKHGYTFRSKPVYHQIADTISEECLFSGPDGVPVLLMVGHRHSSTSMRKGAPHGPFSEIPTISIVAGDLDKTREFYGELLGLDVVTDAETPAEYRELVNDLTGTPKGTRIHFLMFADKPEASGKILCVHFFDRTGKVLKGRMKPGHLGFSLLTHDSDDVVDLYERLQAFGVDIVTPPTRIDNDGAPYIMMMVKGPNEEMLEFTQTLEASKVEASASASAPKAKAKPKAKKAKPKKKAPPKKAAPKKKVTPKKAKKKASNKKPAPKKKVAPKKVKKKAKKKR
ncbi:MAG: VOC family protein [Rhodospirillaceae bacterium]|nr:VOC family protein [Rhodospirillaceae bacterium]